MSFLRDNPWLVIFVAPSVALWLRYVEKKGTVRVARHLRSSSQDAYDMELENRLRAVEELRDFGRKEGYDV